MDPRHTRQLFDNLKEMVNGFQTTYPAWHPAVLAPKEPWFSLDTNLSSSLMLEALLKDAKRLQDTLKTSNAFYASQNITPEQHAYAKKISEELNETLRQVLITFAVQNQLLKDWREADNVPPGELLGIVLDTVTAVNDKQRTAPENQHWKNLNDFAVRSKLGADEGTGLFSHATSKVQKAQRPSEVLADKHQSNWYAKYCEDKQIAAREVVIQEFYRLVMPYQPKTRIARKGDEVYVVSKEVAGSVPLEGWPNYYEKNAESRPKFETGEYSGLGRVMVMNLWLKEDDAKLGNNMIDPQGRVIKIDGDWGLANLRKAGQYSVSAADIENLPFVSDYHPYNWFDIYGQGQFQSVYTTSPNFAMFNSDTFPDNVAFRQEVNETMLQLLVMPKEFIENFVKSYISDKDEIQLITDTLMTSSKELRAAAIVNASFQAYMESPVARTYLENSIATMHDFNTMGKNNLLENDVSAPIAFQQAFLTLKQDTLEMKNTMAAAASVGKISVSAPEPTVADILNQLNNQTPAPAAAQPNFAAPPGPPQKPNAAAAAAQPQFAPPPGPPIKPNANAAQQPQFAPPPGPPPKPNAEQAAQQPQFAPPPGPPPRPNAEQAAKQPQFAPPPGPPTKKKPPPLPANFLQVPGAKNAVQEPKFAPPPGPPPKRTVEEFSKSAAGAAGAGLSMFTPKTTVKPVEPEQKPTQNPTQGKKG